MPEQPAAGPPLLVFNPELVGPAGGPTSSGQGYVNSGLFFAKGGGPTSFELTFDTPGTFRYYCAFHGDPEGGMIGDVIVE